jgi:intracellular sulfur oxidation DsrE/DsrF family protein
LTQKKTTIKECPTTYKPMKSIYLLLSLLLLPAFTKAQTPLRINPIIKTFGGAFEIPYAIEKPDPSLFYKIIVEVQEVRNEPAEVNWALNNAARLINLHVIGGVPYDHLDVVVVVHGEATYAAMNNEAYKTKYKTDNPNRNLFKELDGAGVKLFICGQSLINREVDRTKLVPEIKIATSMITTMTTHMMKGYVPMKF